MGCFILEKNNVLKNIEIDENGEYAVFSVNPAIYPLDLVYSASYIMIEKAFIILDGDPKEKIMVEIRKKKQDKDIKTLVREFNEELLNYAVYKVQSEKNKNIREMILQRALLTNNQDSYSKTEKEKDTADKDAEKEASACEITKREQEDGYRK